MHFSIRRKLPQSAIACSSNNSATTYHASPINNICCVTAVTVFGKMSSQELPLLVSMQMLWICLEATVVLKKLTPIVYFRKLTVIGGPGHWDVSSLTKFNHMFYNAKLKSFGFVKHWDVSQVTDMSGMFKNGSCGDSNPPVNLKNFRFWDVSNVVNMEGVFEWCYVSGFIHIRRWNIRNVKSADKMFAYVYGGSEKVYPLLKAWVSQNKQMVNKIMESTYC